MMARDDAWSRRNRAEFLKVLETVTPGLSKGDLLQQSSCYVFEAGWVATFNEEIACRSPSGLPKDMTGAVRGEPLRAILGAILDEEIEVRITPKHFEVRTPGKKMGIKVEAEITLPLELVERPDSARWEPLPEDFRAAVERVTKYAGTKVEEFVTVCVHLHPEYIEATDRLRACRYNLQLPIDRPFLVRSRSLEHVAKLELSEVNETDSWVHFKHPRSRLHYSCHRHIEPFLDVGRLLDFKGSKTTLPQASSDATKLAAIFSGEDKDNDKVRVRLVQQTRQGERSGVMIVEGTASYGYAEVTVDCPTYKGEDIEFRINPQHLVELMGDHDLRCQIGETRLRVDGEKWTFMSVLGKPSAAPAIRTDEEEPVAVGAGEEEYQED